MSAEPRVGVGCIVRRGSQLLLVRRRGAHGSGTWSTPGGNLDYVQGFVAAGLGVAVVPQLALPTAQADIAIRPLEVEGDLLTRRVGVAMPDALYRPPAMKAMVAILEDVCRGLRHEATARLSGSRRRRTAR